MQIVSLRDNLHEVSDPISLEKIRKNITKLSSAESPLVWLVLNNKMRNGWMPAWIRALAGQRSSSELRFASKIFNQKL